jgi:Zn-finger nucleic acid-binding protein
MANCANCGAPMRSGDDGTLVCAHCGSTGDGKVLYDVDTIGASSESCPQCGTTLDDARIEGCPVRACPSCRGLLVEMQYFAALCDAVRARAFHSGVVPSRRQQLGERVLSCPICKQSMLGHFYGGPGNLVLDTCEHCQVNWLDGDELDRIARAP